MSLTVIKPGMLSSFQDRGRDGYQHQGIPAAGAMDERAHRLANCRQRRRPRHPRNHADRTDAALLTPPPVSRWPAPICAQLKRQDTYAPRWSPGPATRWPSAPVLPGARAYLAVHAGCAASGDGQRDHLHLRSGFGGFQGRPWPVCCRCTPRWTSGAISRRYRKRCGRSAFTCPLAGKRRDTIRFLPGRHWHEFSDASASPGPCISPQSDRMGYRLQGPRWPWRNRARRCRKRPASAPCRCHPAAKPSSSWPTGRPPAATQDRADRLGGPARAGASLPGQELCFQQIELDEAQRLDVERASAFAQLWDALAPMRALLDTIDASGRHPTPDQEDHYESQHRLELRHGRKLRRLGDGQRRAVLARQLGQHRCGFHGGDPATMRDRGRRPGQGVALGAHPGLQDLSGLPPRHPDQSAGSLRPGGLPARRAGGRGSGRAPAPREGARRAVQHGGQG